MVRRPIVLSCLLILAWIPTSGAAQTAPDHGRFSEILEQVVTPSGVDYARLQSIRSDLDRYIASLGSIAPETVERMPADDALAYWINAYNACMLKLVIDHYPIRAGRAGIFGNIRNWVAGYPRNSVWQIRNVFTREHCPIAGNDRSQDEIEHEIIRPTFQEPRIHFAVNCAARSCPVLWPDAYEGDRLEAQLDRAVHAFLASPEHFQLERGPAPTLRLNRVLEWYLEDFGDLRDLRAFLAEYLEPPERDMVLSPDTDIVFLEYDWTLNDIPR